MRRYKKKELLSIVDTLQESKIVLKKCIHKNMVNETMELLTQCQEAAISVGNAIEEICGKGTEPVEMLEDLCELIYECSISPEKQTQKKICRKIYCNLINIRNSIKNDIPEDKLQIVFLPYKASMWDSLESVWYAAMEDENCDAFVIPIPYYVKDQNQTFLQMHYEGEQYPSYVTVTDWQEYDLAAKRPDVIYFHNPYDEYNYVTSVHPKFYSRELKKYTDMLVYIPYFICVDNVPEHFCTVSGIFQADRVVVQSEKVRSTYIRVYEEALGKKQYGDKLHQMIERKFLALGSPKFDKVINTKRDTVVLPQEWREKIYYLNEGGVEQRKKVLLYNTSIQVLLNDKEKVIEKLKYVFCVFREREDVILWWRPHPLIQATMQSMFPLLADEYLQLVQQYQEEGWGIFDDTADINRAIAISDAYYGDSGSLLALYTVTGKPVMIQNIKITGEES